MAPDVRDSKGLSSCCTCQESAAGNDWRCPDGQAATGLHGERHQAAHDGHAGSSQQGHCSESTLQRVLSLHTLLRLSTSECRAAEP